MSEDVYGALDGKHARAEHRSLSLRGKGAPFPVYAIRASHL